MGKQTRTSNYLLVTMDWMRLWSRFAGTHAYPEFLIACYNRLMDSADCLDLETRQVWERYLYLEQNKRRHEALTALNDVIDRLLALPEDTREAWVDEMADAAAVMLANGASGECPFPFRYPLFTRVFFPVLLQAYRAGAPRAAWRLAALAGIPALLKPIENTLGKSRLTLLREAFIQLPDDPDIQRAMASPLTSSLETASLAELQEAYALQPHNQAIRYALIEAFASFFDSCVHEIPAGVLYGMDGARIEDCRVLPTDLDFFERLIRDATMQDKYAKRIAYWRRHFEAYRGFLEEREHFSSYSQYLRKHGIPSNRLYYQSRKAGYGLFAVPNGPRTFGAIVLWWERRRLTYNLIVGVAAMISLPLFFLFITGSGKLAPGEDAVEPMALIFAPIAVNICYTLGWIVEGVLASVLRPFWGERVRRIGPVLLGTGLVFSLLIVFLPAAAWGVEYYFVK